MLKNERDREPILPHPRSAQDAGRNVRQQTPIGSAHSLNLRPILSSALCAALIFAAGLCRAQSNLVLRAGGITLEGDPKSGAILRIHDASSSVTLAPPAGLAENFRLTLQKPDGTNVTVLGKDQALSESRVDGGTMTLDWSGPLKDTAEAGHNLSVRMTITATTGGLTFGLHVTNGSQAKVLEAWYPLVGGLTGFSLRWRQVRRDLMDSYLDAHRAPGRSDRGRRGVRVSRADEHGFCLRPGQVGWKDPLLRLP